MHIACEKHIVIGVAVRVHVCANMGVLVRGQRRGEQSVACVSVSALISFFVRFFLFLLAVWLA